MDILEQYPDLKRLDFVEFYDFGSCHTAQNPDAPFSEFEVAVALLHTNGNLSRAGHLLNRSRRSLEGFITRNPGLLLLQEDIVATKVDAIEQGQFAKALGGDPLAERFILQTLGKERGFSTRAEVTGKNGGVINVNISGEDAGL